MSHDAYPFVDESGTKAGGVNLGGVNLDGVSGGADGDHVFSDRVFSDRVSGDRVLSDGASDDGASDDGAGLLRISRRDFDDRSCIIELGGELDLRSAVELRAEVSAALEQRPPPAHIEVDLADVTFVDSLGLGTLIVGQRICAQLGVRLTVRNPSVFAERLMRVSGLSSNLLSSRPSTLDKDSSSN
jgi:anti-sigma B factor antagonist